MIRMLVASAALSGLLLGGCVSTTEVVPAGKDSFMIGGSANGGPAGGKSLIAATKQANQYCANLGKVMVIRRTDTGGNAGFGGEHSNLIFSCVSESDPEYQRPNLHKDPTTIIQDQRKNP